MIKIVVETYLEQLLSIIVSFINSLGSNVLKKNQIQGKFYSCIKIIHKVQKKTLKPPIWSIMDEISKNKEKMYIGLQWGVKFNLAPNLVLN
jgi:hypothetical protein